MIKVNFYEVSVAAKKLGISEQAIYFLIRDGQLVGLKVQLDKVSGKRSKRILVSQQSVKDYLNS